MAPAATANAILGIIGIIMLILLVIFVICLIRCYCKEGTTPGREEKVIPVRHSQELNGEDNRSKVHQWISTTHLKGLSLKVPLNALQNYIGRKKYFKSEGVMETAYHVPRDFSPSGQSMLGAHWDDDVIDSERNVKVIVQEVAVQPNIQVPVDSNYSPALGLSPRIYKHTTTDMFADEYPRVMGKLGFSLEYNRFEEKLNVTIIGTKNLPLSKGNQKEAAGTFVSVVLLPNVGRRFGTKVHRNTVNPQFSETTSFPVPASELRDVTLKLNIVRLDVYSKPTVIGQVTYPFRDLFLGKLPHGAVWEDIQPCGKKACEEEKSEVLVCLQYDSIRQVLTVELVQARNANPALFLHLPPSCAAVSQTDVLLSGRISLVRGNHILGSHRTATQRGSFDPVFKENFAFDVSLWGVNQVGLIISVCQRLDLHTEMLGKVTLGSHVGRNISEILEISSGTPQWYPLD
ncbi:synaptotagmin-2-like [Branchiostoma floridae]|uniref:Synaptotagmin-2-like n=2 Tax=Branchiostoma floridae TaxID=7739 RepID=A0A9J7KWB6_BRAFL|nr:synaptotagmin-2-like [Branchiostoma floridae]